jgi:hypothetical protein
MRRSTVTIFFPAGGFFLRDFLTNMREDRNDLFSPMPCAGRIRRVACSALARAPAGLLRRWARTTRRSARSAKPCSNTPHTKIRRY